MNNFCFLCKIQLCDSPPGENDDNSIVSGGSTIYSTPLAQLGSTNDLANAAASPPSVNASQSQSLNQAKDGAVTSKNSSRKTMVNNVQSSNGSKLQTGNGTDIDSQKPMQNSKDAYLSPNSQRRSCLAGHSGETVSK